MTNSLPAENASQQPLRLWPGVVAVALQWLLRFGLPAVMPDALLYGFVAELIGAAAILAWWIFFSRADWRERLGAIVIFVAVMLGTSLFVDKSIATGMMGMMLTAYSIPVLCLALVAWAVLTNRLSGSARWMSMAAAALLAGGSWALLRTDGMSGDGAADLHWRWSQTKEEQLVSKGEALPSPAVPPQSPVLSAPKAAGDAPTPKTADPEASPIAVAPVPEMSANWPGFRGAGRDSIIPGIRIQTDWTASPPIQMWRQPIGPGWGSFAVSGNLAYTQEQRGEDELVTCYSLATGKLVWAHRDAARFWESNAGAGPRGTPTLHGELVYALGATGILNALDARTGAVLWTRNAASDTGAKLPGWGFAGSPLVVGDLVVVATGGQLAAYDAAAGAQRWMGPVGGDGYSSPHLMTLDGVQQIVLVSGTGAASVEPAGGAVLWKYAWTSGTRIMQPSITPDGDLLMTSGDAMGGGNIRRIGIHHTAAGWTTEERWTSSGLKPSFNDFVVYDGNVYGFDGAILACIDLKDGKRRWKGGRYGMGQMILLRDQGVLVVLSEEGGLALVSAIPDKFTELAKFPAIEGKTWNHPVLAGDRLLVRNGNEMAEFKLALAKK